MVKVHLVSKQVHDSQKQEWHFISVRYIEVLQNDSYNDQNRKLAATRHSTAKNEEFYALKTTLRPKIPKISITEQKRYIHDRRNTGYNLKEIKVFLKSRLKHHSRKIKFSKNSKRTHKKSLPELKKGLQNLTKKKRHKTT